MVASFSWHVAHKPNVVVVDAMIYIKPGAPAAYSPWIEVVQRVVLHSMRPGHGLKVLFRMGFPFSSLPGVSWMCRHM